MVETRYGTAVEVKLLSTVRLMLWVATPVLSVMLVGPPITICPEVTLQVTVAPDTGLPWISVAFTDIGWKACRVAVIQMQAAWPLPDCTARWATAEVPVDEPPLQARAALTAIWISATLTMPSELRSLAAELLPRASLMTSCTFATLTVPVPNRLHVPPLVAMPIARAIDP